MFSGKKSFGTCPAKEKAGRSQQGNLLFFHREDKMKQVVIDQEECIGCGACVELCPDIFALDEDENKAYVTTPEGGDEACIDEAIASCPTSCITNDEA